MYDFQRVLQMYYMTYTDSFGGSGWTDNCFQQLSGLIIVFQIGSGWTDNCFQIGKLPLIGENVFFSLRDAFACVQ
jgi:hypothetical protein